jgi:Ni/Co efflux regulator RcnB
MSAHLKLGALLLALATAATPALAAPRDHGDRGHGRSHNQYDGRHDRRDAYRNGYRDGRRDDYRGSPAPRFREYRPAPRVAYRPAPRYYYAPRPVVVHRGPPPWARGARYYGGGYGPTYVVNDWYGYGLRRPPPGYYWRRSDLGDFLLVAAATGIITDLILHH